MSSKFLQIGIGTSFLLIPALLLSKQPFQCKAEQATGPRIAIIGSGIGGSAAAYFARQMFGANASIDVFEKTNRVGGRLATVEVEGYFYEAGGSIIHPDNKYMGFFVKDLGLKKIKSTIDSNALMGVYDGTEFVFLGSRWKIINYLKMLWRYGFDLFTLNSWVKGLLNEFSNIYSIQKDGKAFNTVPELLKAIGGDKMYKYTQQNIREALQGIGVKDRLIDELVTAVMRVNYGQDEKINAFAGGVSLAGAQGGLWSVEGGNWKVCEALLNVSKAELHKETQVTKISKQSQAEHDSSPLYHLKTNKEKGYQTYDIVIVAVPLDVYYFGCDGCKNWPKPETLKRFQQTVASFIVGNINSSFFESEKEADVPENIFTTENPKNFFNSIGVQTPVSGRKLGQTENKVRKVFSRQQLTNSQIDTLFLDRKVFKPVVWLAYPHFTPPETFHPFVLDKGVFYVNAIEWAASAMEMSTVAAKNSVLLAHNYYYKKQPSSIKETKTFATEL